MARVAALLLVVFPLIASSDGYVGRAVCASCHKGIAATQSRTAMAQTWQTESLNQLPANYIQTHAEGPDAPLDYLVRRLGNTFEFQLKMPATQPLTYPVETVMGGIRHGTSFLFRVPNLDGLPLSRPPLVEGRYLHYAPKNQLALSPGFPTDKPQTLETALGRVLSPTFEKKCLTCHGEPRTIGTHRDSGITCESCHGPGQPHLAALGKQTLAKGILNPSKLPAAERMQTCSQCHSGFNQVEDPMPDDLLISDQVTALKNSECWRQTAGEISCTSCHNPHQDAPRAVLIQKSEKTCMSCHSASVAKHAGLCPVNRTSGCVGCHMPDEKRAPFVIADHWIRVRPDQELHSAHAGEWRSQVTPRHLYLRMIALSDEPKASALQKQLISGASFFDSARANSIDQASGQDGGFLGDLEADQLDASWAPQVLKLEPSQISEVIEANGRYLIFQRLPRNFRETAEARFNKAMDLRKQSKRDESVAELFEALKIYPRLLRALTYLGISYGEAGNPQTSAGILTLASRLYPNDAGLHFNLGIAYGAMRNDNEIAEYKRALDINPDLVSAYLNWGSALYGKGQYKEAILVFRDGITINPLFASLHYSLGVALEQDRQLEAAQAEFALARKIDPNVGSH